MSVNFNNKLRTAITPPVDEFFEILVVGWVQHEKHKSHKDPEHAHRHKLEEEIAAAAAVGAGGYAFHEHHEKKEAKEEEEESNGKKHHHLF